VHAGTMGSRRDSRLTSSNEGLAVDGGCKAVHGREGTCGFGCCSFFTLSSVAPRARSKRSCRLHSGHPSDWEFRRRERDFGASVDFRCRSILRDTRRAKVNLIPRRKPWFRARALGAVASPADRHAITDCVSVRSSPIGMRRDIDRGGVVQGHARARSWMLKSPVACPWHPSE
jgi:hypothetical protein